MRNAKKPTGASCDAAVKDVSEHGQRGFHGRGRWNRRTYRVGLRARVQEAHHVTLTFFFSYDKHHVDTLLGEDRTLLTFLTRLSFTMDIYAICACDPRFASSKFKDNLIQMGSRVRVRGIKIAGSQINRNLWKVESTSLGAPATLLTTELIPLP